MRKVIYIGGVGSDSYMAGLIAQALSTHFDTNVAGFSFRDAYRHGALIAQLAPDSLVITHSAGMVLLKHMAPKELIAIAPPMPTPPSALFLRSAPKTVALLRSGKESASRPRRIRTYHIHALKEHLLWPHYNSLRVSEISMFNAAQTAVEMTKRGSRVTIAFMENDKLYPDVSQHPHIAIARKNGVTIGSPIIGQHDEFLLYPVEVLAQIAKS